MGLPLHVGSHEYGVSVHANSLSVTDDFIHRTERIRLCRINAAVSWILKKSIHFTVFREKTFHVIKNCAPYGSTVFIGCILILCYMDGPLHQALIKGFLVGYEQDGAWKCGKGRF